VRDLSTVGRAALNCRRDDLYETPPEAVQALMRAETLPHRIWEPAAGRDAIVNILRAAGHEVLASDLVDYGHPTHFAQRDFLLEWTLPKGCEMILTNPPFKLANEFVEHAIDLCPRVVMLLRFLFLEGTRRSEILEERGIIRIHLFSRRLQGMHRDGWDGNKVSNSRAFAWFVWDREHRGPPTVHRI
jgi:hypothetical protein